MKKIFIIVLSLSVGCLHAQEMTIAQKKTAGEKVYTLFAKYAEYSSLKDGDKGYAITDSSTRRFKELFTDDAKIYGEIIDTDTTDYIITRSEMPIQQYLDEAKARFLKGLNAKTVRANITFGNLAQKQVKIVYERTVNSMNSSGKTYISKDTLVMAVNLSDDFSSAKIAYISQLHGNISCLNCEKQPKASVIAKPSTVTASAKPAKEKPVKEKPVKEKPVVADNRCPNDDDCDGVNNLVDKCPGVKGTEAKQGCPESPLSVGLSVDLGIGAGLNSSSTADVSANTLGYHLGKTLSESDLKLKSKIGLGINASVLIDLLFTEKRNIGVSAGVLIAYSSTKSVAEGFKVEYMANDRKSREFRRILTANEITEKVAFTNIDIPILFTYKTPTDENKKIGFLLGIGPVISVHTAAKSSMDGTMDFEAVYSTTDGQLGYSAQTTGSDYLLTRAGVTKTLTRNVETPFRDVNHYFDRHYERGYFIGLDQSAEGSETVKYKIGFGGMVRLGMIYQITNSFAFKAGVYTLLTYHSHDAVSSDFKPVDAANDFDKPDGIKLNSLLNTTSSMMNTQFGINVGVQYIFKH